MRGRIYITGPEKCPPSKILYFPNGTYLVSNTVSYTFENLNSQQQKDFICEMCRNIHLIGESRENTVIRLADHSDGFEQGTKKPVISFNRAHTEGKRTSNVAQMNSLEDITVDCGKGNPGAVGVLYASSNNGRIENVNVCAEDSMIGIDFDYDSQACVSDVTVYGFDYGIRTEVTSPIIMTDTNLSQNRIAAILTKNGNLNCQNMKFGDLSPFKFDSGDSGRYAIDDSCLMDSCKKNGNSIFKIEKTSLLKSKPTPKNASVYTAESCAYVDDYGAVGDEKTDCTVAIQKAMNSGKKVILFGSGTYRIERSIQIPSSVKTIDFMYASLLPGYSLTVGEIPYAFDICEQSEDTLFVEHFTPDDTFCGFFRMFRHSAKRNVVFKDMSFAAPLYYNTVEGSEVWFDNCFTHTKHYFQDAILKRDGYTPVFCRMLPIELHGQRAYGRNLNIERADIELLNDGSELIIDGYKVEGPGTLIKSINGGKTQINLFNAAWWGNQLPDHPMFDIQDSQIELIGGYIFGHSDDERLCLALKVKKEGKETNTSLQNCSTSINENDIQARNLGQIIEHLVCD